MPDYKSYDISIRTPLNPNVCRRLKDELVADGFAFGYEYVSLDQVDFSTILPHFTRDLFIKTCKKYIEIKDEEQTIYIDLIYYNKIKKAWPYDMSKVVKNKDTFHNNFYCLTDIRNMFKCIDYYYKVNLNNLFLEYKDYYYYHYNGFTKEWEDRIDKNTVDKMILDLNIDRKYLYAELCKKYIYSRQDIFNACYPLIKDKKNYTELSIKIHKKLNDLTHSSNSKIHKYISIFKREDAYTENEKNDVLADLLKIKLKILNTNESIFSLRS